MDAAHCLWLQAPGGVGQAVPFGHQMRAFALRQQADGFEAVFPGRAGLGERAGGEGAGRAQAKRPPNLLHQALHLGRDAAAAHRALIAQVDKLFANPYQLEIQQQGILEHLAVGLQKGHQAIAAGLFAAGQRQPDLGVLERLLPQALGQGQRRAHRRSIIVGAGGVGA